MVTSVQEEEGGAFEAPTHDLDDECFMRNQARRK